MTTSYTRMLNRPTVKPAGMSVKSTSGGDTLRFEHFEIDTAQRQVRVNGQPVAMGARAFDVLAALIEHRDRVVGKDELLALAWPGLVVEENNLTVQVSALRKSLGRRRLPR